MYSCIFWQFHEAACVEFFAIFWMLAHLVVLRVSLILGLELRIFKAVRFEHHDLVLTFVILVVCVVRDPSLRRNLARSF